MVEAPNSEAAPCLRGKPLAHDSKLILGFLPYGYVHQHIRRWNEVVSLWYRFDRKQRQWSQRLQQEGWALSDDDPTILNHRYVRVSYYDL